MRTLRGTHEDEMSRADLIALARGSTSLDLDIGTGDGLFVVDRARARPDHFVVGLDPVAEAMSAAANRVSRPRSRLDNVLFVVASVEQMPAELSELFHNVFINLPWGSLMRGLILADPVVLRALAGVGQQDAVYRIRLNLRIFTNPIPKDVQDLPEITESFVRSHLIEPYARAGIEIQHIRELSSEELSTLRSSWARRLSHRQPPPTLEITARRR